MFSASGRMSSPCGFKPSMVREFVAYLLRQDSRVTVQPRQEEIDSEEGEHGERKSND